MGKSTITKKLFLSAIEKKVGIPILIEIRQINKNNDFLKELQNQLSPIGKKLSIDFILKLIGEGQFIFLFDGFDEISKADKEFVIKDLHRFVERTNNNYFLITPRQEDSLVSFGDFQKFNIKPLKDKEAFSLIKRYDSYSFKPIAKELIKRLSENETLKEFLSNPFLVSLLYKSFEYKKDIPIKKCQFYRQVYEALFESHDLSKEGYFKRDKYSNLHSDDFERVLRYVGYFTSIENKVEYDTNYIINIIDKVKKHTPDLTFKSSDYLRDLLETVPLFKKDGNYIKWAHKSVQDYYAAKFIWIDAKTNQRVILQKIYRDDDNRRFYNMLDLFYELDSNVFDETILRWLLEDFEKYSINTYKNYNHIDHSLLKKRIENLYHKKCLIVVTKKQDYHLTTSASNYYRNKAQMINFDTGRATYHYFRSSKIIVICYIKVIPNINTILKLVSKRIPDLAEYKIHNHELVEELELLKEDELYICNDEIDNILNNQKIFKMVNGLILCDYTINYDNALKKLKQIQFFEKQQRQNEFTDW